MIQKPELHWISAIFWHSLDFDVVLLGRFAQQKPDLVRTADDVAGVAEAVVRRPVAVGVQVPAGEVHPQAALAALALAALAFAALALLAGPSPRLLLVDLGDFLVSYLGRRSFFGQVCKWKYNRRLILASNFNYGHFSGVMGGMVGVADQL